MQNVLHELESHLLRGAAECALVLGVSSSNYSAMKTGARPLPRYVAYHVEALIALPLDVMHGIVKKRLRRKRGSRGK